MKSYLATAAAIALGLLSSSALGGPLLLTNDIAGCPLLEGNDSPECNGKLEVRADELGMYLDAPGYICAFDSTVIQSELRMVQ